jgi:hypothetical protein
MNHSQVIGQRVNKAQFTQEMDPFEAQNTQKGTIFNHIM